MPKVVTVLGEVDPSEIGKTLTHEHMTIDVNAYYTPLQDEKAPTDWKWTLEYRGQINRYPYSFKDNLSLNDAAAEDAIFGSVRNFRTYGGGCLVDNSTVGLHRSMPYLQKLSKATGVHIVAGAGFYVDAFQDSTTLTMSVEKMADYITQELNEGSDGSKCGLIGEVGITQPMTDFERRSIVASAHAQQDCGCAVSFHPGRDTGSPKEILRIFQEAGGKAEKTIMSHLDRTLQTKDTLLDFVSTGAYCQFDLFGIECSYYQLSDVVDFPSDAQRIERVMWLLQDGFEDRVLLAHDVHTKHRLEAFGGHGYKHILQSVEPKMKAKGVSEGDMRKILVENPARILTVE